MDVSGDWDHLLAAVLSGFCVMTDSEIELWEQARGELRGFANALERGLAGLTAAQLRMAITLADRTWEIAVRRRELQAGADCEGKYSE